MKPNQSKVSVHVDVVVDGAKATTTRKRTNVKAVGLNPRPFAITSPASGSIVTGFLSGGAQVFAANGGSLASQGFYPTVYAKVFPIPPGVDMTQQYYQEYPANAPDDPDLLSTTADQTAGTWFFDAAHANPIPGAAFDNNNMPGAAANNTLIIWYEYDFDDGDVEYTYEGVAFHGYMSPNSGSNRLPEVATPADLPATKLVATFTGALSALGPVKLIWNGVSWVGTSSHGGGAVLSLSGNDPVYQLLAYGPVASFVVAGQANSFRPFSWTAAGTAIGSVHGPFKVTITE